MNDDTGTHHSLLPWALQQALIAASQIDPGVPVGESPARSRAIQEVISRARWKHPQFFGCKGR